MKRFTTCVLALFPHYLKIYVENTNNPVFGVFIFILYTNCFSFTKFGVNLTFYVIITLYFLFEKYKRKHYYDL